VSGNQREDFRRGLLEVLLMVNRNINEMRAELKGQIQQLQALAIDHAQELTTIRSRLIEQSSRHGTEIHEHEKALIKHDVRLTKIERALGSELDTRTPDAE